MVAVVLSVWPLLVLLGAATIGAAWWWAVTGDHGLVLLTLPFWKATVLGLIGSFALHESAHVAFLRRCPGVTSITLERTALRVSVAPTGVLTPRQAALTAVAGPGSCVLVGFSLWATADATLAPWYLMHGVFLLPPFGDGMALVRSMRAAHRSRRPSSDVDATGRRRDPA
ncbi:hypothetical protein ACNHYB_10350 [Isoptericola jiangsuensis]|uniref:hypothetical protein n=1 Tax=Isoptericola jiangsuensis TaxID=548579 RepID=UPI003AAB5644